MNIYIIKGGQRYKIGKADNVKMRLSRLQTASPIRLHLVAYLPIENAFEMESKIHKDLSEYRVMREWFEFDDKVLRLVIKAYGFTAYAEKEKISVYKLKSEDASIDNVLIPVVVLCEDMLLDRPSKNNIMEYMGYTEKQLSSLKRNNSPRIQKAIAAFKGIGFDLIFNNNSTYPFLKKIA